MYGPYKLPTSRNELDVISNAIKAYLAYVRSQPRTNKTRTLITTLQDVRARIQDTLKAGTTDWVVPLSAQEHEAVQVAILGFTRLILAYIPQSRERDEIAACLQSLQRYLAGGPPQAADR
jgi:cellulase/cellobiase CelA1